MHFWPFVLWFRPALYMRLPHVPPGTPLGPLHTLQPPGGCVVFRAKVCARERGFPLHCRLKRGPGH